jgi:hypothetical protein
MKKYCKNCERYNENCGKCDYEYDIKTINKVTGEEETENISSYNLAEKDIIGRFMGGILYNKLGELIVDNVPYILNWNNNCKYYKEIDGV